jgi:hypothetical protein
MEAIDNQLYKINDGYNNMMMCTQISMGCPPSIDDQRTFGALQLVGKK